MKERHKVCNQPSIEEVEAAIRGRGPAFTCVLTKGLRSMLYVRRLSPVRLRAWDLARETGHLVHKGQTTPWRSFDVWHAYCLAAGRPLVRSWAKGVRSSTVELDLSTSPERLSEPDFERLWALLCEHARVVQGGPDWLCAWGVHTADVQELAGELVSAVCG